MRLEASKGRLVLSTQYFPDSSDVTQVLFDDHRIGTEAAKILHEYGHERVLQLCGPSTYASAEERSRGFTRASRKYSMRITNLVGKMNWRSGYEFGTHVLRLLEEDDPPTAVFASNDWMALGLMQRLAEEHVAVPSAISIIGCDDTHLSAEMSPGLSTFRWDMAYIVAELFAIIDSLGSRKTGTHKRVLLPAQFIKRESLARRSGA